MITLDLSILNQKGTPMFYSDIFANRPAFGIVGRIFISTDTYEFYRDTGTAWDLIGGTGTGTITGSGTIGTLSKFTSSSSIGDSIVSEIGSALTINGTGKATNWYVGTPSDLTRAFSASGNANNVAIWLEEYGNTPNSGDVFMFKGRGTESAKANIQVGDNTGAISTGGYINGNLLSSANWFAEVVNVDTTNNHADSDWKLTQSYNSAGFTETFRIRASDGFVTAPNGGFSNTLTKTAISTEGWYGVASVENITLPANISFSNSGFTQGSLLGVNLMTFQGNATFANGNGTTSIFGQNGFGFSSAGSTITINQRATGINAYAGVTAFNYINGTTNGTITHLAGLHVLAPYQTSSAILQVDNYYGTLINASNERTAFTITNRWGIYQEGTLDKNYFAANMLLGSIVDNGNRLQITGNASSTGYMQMAAIFISNTDGVVGQVNSTAANGGYMTWQTSGTTIADIGTAQQIFGTGGNNTFGINARGARSLAFGTNNTERFTIISNGNIGVRNNAPSYEFDITATGGSLGTLRINNGGTGASDGSQILLGNSANFTNAFFRLNGGGNSSQSGIGSLNIGLVESAPIGFYTANTLRATLNSLGNLGIGNLAANAKLEVSSSTGEVFRADAASGAYRIVANQSVVVLGGSANVLINSFTDPGQKLYLNGSLRIDGQSSGTAGGSSGQHLIINLDGTTYKIALLNP